MHDAFYKRRLNASERGIDVDQAVQSAVRSLLY